MVKVINTSGRRKRAVAHASLRPGTGAIRFNRLLIENIEPKLLRLRLQEPLFLAKKVASKVNVSIFTEGGGVLGQIEAGRLALARALVTQDKKLEQIFLDYDRHLLVADVRRKEQCKPNDSKARAKRQKSYR